MFAVACAGGDPLWRTLLYLSIPSVKISSWDSSEFSTATEVNFFLISGPESAEYAAKYFPTILQNNENFKQKKYEDALTETFVKIDEMMKSKAGMK
jgi:hypothetical protein